MKFKSWKKEAQREWRSLEVQLFSVSCQKNMSEVGGSVQRRQPIQPQGGVPEGPRVVRLPACRQVHPVDRGMLGQEQLQVCKQGEVIWRDVGVRAASDVVLQEPVVVQRSKDTQNVQLRLRAEDVIDHTL